MNRRAEQKHLTKLVMGWPCQIRLPGICNGSPETTVPCHFPLGGISGMGYISEAILIAAGCSDCHRYVDTHDDDATRLAHAEGVMRTQIMLVKVGAIQW